MAKQTVHVGLAANDGLGDPIRTAFEKLNDNFTELYNLLGQNADGPAPIASVLRLESAAAGQTNLAGANSVLELSKSTGSGLAGTRAIKAGFAGKGAASATVTMTIATPCVVTWTAHGFGLGQKIVLTTDGALPTGLTAGTTYYAVPTGANTFNLATTMANAEAGTVIATSGTQSGTHTGTTLATTQNEAGTIATWGPRSLTGSQTTPVLDLKQTWNTSGAATGLRFVANDVSSPSTSKLLELLHNASQRFAVFKDGRIDIDGGSNLYAFLRSTSQFREGSLLIGFGHGAGGQGIAWGDGQTNPVVYGGAGQSGIIINQGLYYGWASSTIASNPDLMLRRDGAAGVLGQHDGVNAQVSRIYRTRTDSSNYERMALQSGSGYFELACETAGTGGDNLDLRLTPTGTGRVVISGSGDVSLNLGIGAGKAAITSGSYVLSFFIDGGNRGSINNAGDWSPLTHLRLASANSLIWNSDTFLSRDAANTLAQRNGTAAQVSRLYRTFTDASNYERLAIQSSAGIFELACETAGTGADDLDLQLTPAGAGRVRFGTHSALAGETVTGFITIKDASGTTRKLAVVS